MPELLSLADKPTIVASESGRMVSASGQSVRWEAATHVLANARIDRHGFGHAWHGIKYGDERSIGWFPASEGAWFIGDDGSSFVVVNGVWK